MKRLKAFLASLRAEVEFNPRAWGVAFIAGDGGIIITLLVVYVWIEWGDYGRAS